MLQSDQIQLSSTPTVTTTDLPQVLTPPRRRQHAHKRSLAVSGDFDFLKQTITNVQPQPQPQSQPQSQAIFTPPKYTSPDRVPDPSIALSPRFFASEDSKFTSPIRGVPDAIINLDDALGTKAKPRSFKSHRRSESAPPELDDIWGLRLPVSPLSSRIDEEVSLSEEEEEQEEQEEVHNSATTTTPNRFTQTGIEEPKLEVEDSRSVSGGSNSPRTTTTTTNINLGHSIGNTYLMSPLRSSSPGLLNKRSIENDVSPIKPRSAAETSSGPASVHFGNSSDTINSLKIQRQKQRYYYYTKQLPVVVSIPSSGSSHSLREQKSTSSLSSTVLRTPSSANCVSSSSSRGLSTPATPVSSSDKSAQSNSTLTASGGTGIGNSSVDPKTVTTNKTLAKDSDNNTYHNNNNNTTLNNRSPNAKKLPYYTYSMDTQANKSRAKSLIRSPNGSTMGQRYLHYPHRLTSPRQGSYSTEFNRRRRSEVGEVGTGPSSVNRPVTQPIFRFESRVYDIPLDELSGDNTGDSREETMSKPKPKTKLVEEDDDGGDAMSRERHADDSEVRSSISVPILSRDILLGEPGDVVDLSTLDGKTGDKKSYKSDDDAVTKEMGRLDILSGAKPGESELLQQSSLHNRRRYHHRHQHQQQQQQQEARSASDTAVLSRRMSATSSPESSSNESSSLSIKNGDSTMHRKGKKSGKRRSKLNALMSLFSR